MDLCRLNLDLNVTERKQAFRQRQMKCDVSVGDYAILNDLILFELVFDIILKQSIPNENNSSDTKYIYFNLTLSFLLGKVHLLSKSVLWSVADIKSTTPL